MMNNDGEMCVCFNGTFPEPVLCLFVLVNHIREDEPLHM